MELEKLPHLLRPSLCLSALSPGPWITGPVHIRWRKVGGRQRSPLGCSLRWRRDVLLRLALDWSLAWSELGEPQGLVCCLLEACQAGVQGSGILPDYATQNSPSTPAAPPSPGPPTQIERSYA